jgi:excisionase family DNA binding protein
MKSDVVPRALRRAERVRLSEKLVWDVRDTADACCVSTRTIQAAAYSGALRSLKVGKRRLFKPADVMAWLELQRVS